MTRLGLATCLLVAACSRTIELLPQPDGSPDRDGGATSDLGDAGTADATLSCTGLGMPIRFDSNATEQCASAIAASSHRFALCTCSTLEVSQSLESDAFDSTGLTSGSGTTAAVGTNGDFKAMSNVKLAGALYVGGIGGLIADDSFQTAESLRVAGPVALMGSVNRVGTDAYVADAISGSGTVVGVLHIPAVATVDPMIVAGSIVREAVAVPTPCDCSTSLVDVGTALTAAASSNDNAAIGLAGDALKGISVATTLELPCGRFLLSEIDTFADVTLNVHGRSELAVSGNVKLRGKFAVVLDGGAELDLVLGGTLSATSGGTLGNTAAPARVRIWTLTTDTVLLDSAPIVGAVVHAPRASVSSPLGLELFGSMVARSFLFGGPVNLHYDRATLGGGVVCGSSAQPAVQ